MKTPKCPTALVFPTVRTLGVLNILKTDHSCHFPQPRPGVSPPLQRLATTGAEGTIRTIGAWLGYNVPAVAQLKGHLLPSAELGPAWESSAEELA